MFLMVSAANLHIRVSAQLKIRYLLFYVSKFNHTQTKSKDGKEAKVQLLNVL